MIENYFTDGGEDMWRICFREYDKDGNLTELISCKSITIKSKWKAVKSFLKSCNPDHTREVQFCKNGKQMPSLVSNGKETRFDKPISAMLPLFDYSREHGVVI